MQVKSGHVKVGDIRDLRGTVERENASIGVFIILEKPSKPMVKEAVSAGYYTSENYPKIQILTIEELLDENQIEMPPQHGTFKQAEKVKKEEGVQGRMDI